MQTMLPGLALEETTMDVQAFQAFYQENLGPIYRYVYHQVSNREEAEDLTSEIFLKAVSSIDRERSLRSMQYWLYLIARTTIADYWRVHYRRPTRSLDALLEAGWEGPVDEELTAIKIESAELAQNNIVERCREHSLQRYVMCPLSGRLLQRNITRRSHLTKNRRRN